MLKITLTKLWMAILLSIQTINSKGHSYLWIHSLEKFEQLVLGRKESKSTFKGHNMATDLKRQVGSTMKPIFDYGPAIENLQWSTYHQLNDSEYTYSNGKKYKMQQRATKVTFHYVKL